LTDPAPNVKSDALKRRSTRIVQAVPLTVTGVDALGRPFEERTSTSILNCHGCRYQSKHYVLKNMWVTLEVPHPEQGRPPRSVRARVMWIQRPRTVRELFQVGVELEVPGNIWGIAFCPPDWFPFPESGIHVAAPAAHALPEETSEAMPAENATWSGAAESLPADNVRTMPLTVPADSPAEPPPAPAPAPAPAQLTGETGEQLRADVRDYAAEAVATEARRLLASLQSQLQEASDKAAQAATSAAAEKAIQNAMAKSEAAAEERLRALADRLSNEFGRNFEQQYQKFVAQSGEIEPARRGALAQQLEIQLNEGVSQLQAAARAAANDFQAAVERSRENVETLRREMESCASTVLQDGAERLKAQAEDARMRVVELESVQRQVLDQITSVFHSAESDWQARLEASTAAAAERWNEQLGASNERAAQQLAERLAVSSLLAREQFEKELGDRVAGTGKTLQDAAADAENRLGAARTSFDNQIVQVQSLFAVVQASAQALAEQTRQIEATHKAAQEEVERRAAALVELHSQELARSGESAIAAWTGRLQPSLEAAGQQTVRRLGAQLEEELSSQFNRASLALGRLESQTLAAEEMARKLEQQLAARFAQTVDAASAQLQKQLDVMGGDFQEAGRNSVQRWLAEVESKATETTHATFESLFKTADWYEKKVQNQMQSTLEKGLEQGVHELREKAGEISRVFAGELDHYSRSYVEHTQGQVEEAGREAQERAKKLAQELTISTVYATSQQMQGKAEAALGEFEGKLVAALGERRAQMEEQVARARAEVEAITRRISSDFGAAVTQHAHQVVGTMRNELSSQMASAREKLLAESEERRKQLHEALAAASDEGVEAYKQRLESAANSWLLTTASKLNQQSTQQLDALTRAAETRLNETCKQVFAKVGEALHRQLLDLTPPPPAPPASPAKDSGDQTS